MASMRAWPAVFYFFIITATAAAINITITVPEGTTDHGDPKLLCTPISWTDIATFFLGNYVAHAATVPTFLGTTKGETYFNRFMALLLPGFGLFKGISMFLRFANLGKSELEVAVRAQALYTVIRTQAWKPKAGDIISNSLLRLNDVEPETKESETSTVAQFYVYETSWGVNKDDLTSDPIPWKSIHGQREDPPTGYRFAPVPREEIVDPIHAEEHKCTIAFENNFLKSLIAVGQTLYGVSTLYRAKGDQISRYGYAAFGLTVTPYVFMSLVNLCAGLMCPHYAQAYLVDSSILLEARQRDAKFHVIVGNLREAESTIGASPNSGLLAVDGSLAISGVSQNGEDLEDLKVGLNIIQQHPRNGESHANTVISETVNEPQEAANARLEHCSFRVQKEFRKYNNKVDINSFSNHTLFIPQCNPLSINGEHRIDYNVGGAVWDEPNMKWSFTISRYETSKPFTNSSIAVLFTMLLAPIPFIIIAGLTKFEDGGSSYAQRAWTMAWLCAGQGLTFWLVLQYMLMSPFLRYLSSEMLDSITVPIAMGLFSVPAMGGFVVVGKMLMEYGTCVALE